MGKTVRKEERKVSKWVMRSKLRQAKEQVTKFRDMDKDGELVRAQMHSYKFRGT